MPTTGSMIKFLSGLKSAYTAIVSKDANTLYFCTDTQQLYLGDKEYTKSNVGTLTSPPTSSKAGEYGKIYYCLVNESIYMCSGESQSTEGEYIWTRVANINDKNGTVTSVATGDGLTGGPITSSGTISHAVPSGASEGSVGDADAQTPAFGGTFKVTSQTTDKFGHVTAQNEHTVKIPNATFGATSVGLVPAPGTATGKFLKDNGTWETPANTTYTLSSSADGQVTITPSSGDAQTVTISGWSNLATKSDITAVFKFKGTVATVDGLPASATEGDVYHVTEKHTEYVYVKVDGAAKATWEELGGIMDLSAYALSADVIQRVTGETGEVPKFNADGTLSSTGFTLGVSVPADAKFTDTTYSDFTGATSSAAGATGLVPAPTAGSSRYLKSDGTWAGKQTMLSDLGTYTENVTVAGLVPAVQAHTNSTDYILTGKGWTQVKELTQFAGSDAGLVPTVAASTGKFLKDDGTWSDTISKANALATARTITLSGGVTSSAVSFDGSDNITITTTLSNFASNKVTALTGYSAAASYSAISATDSLNTALGKLEAGITTASDSLIWGSF